jgi:hypothetical protein
LHGAPRVAGLLIIAALLLALLELAQIARAGHGNGMSAELIVSVGFVSGALLLNASVLLGASICLGAWALSAVWHHRGVRRFVAFAGLVLLAGACWGLAVRLLAGAGATRALGSAKTPATIALCAALLGATIFLAFGARQLLRRRSELGRGPILAWGMGIMFAAILADLVNRRLYVGLYLEIHTLLALATSVMTVALVGWLGFLRGTRRNLPVAVGLLIVVGGVAAGVHANRALAARRQLVSSMLSETTIAREVLSLAWWILDADGDGHSPALGGGDCDDTEAHVHPGALEIAGNGVDEDCIGGDLAADAEPPRATEIRPSPVTTEPQRTAPRARLPDILLFSVDALRADRLGCYGYSDSTTPTMDGVAARGTRFTNVYVTSTSSATSLPAIVAGSYFSNLYPEVKSGGSASPKDKIPTRTILNDLASRGYRVIATVPTSFRNYFLGEGIEWSAPSGLSTPSLTEILRQAEDGPDAPLALWFHHMDAHLSFTREFLSELQQTVPPELNERYDAGVRRADDDLRILLEWQSARSGLDNTIIVVTADHGEEFAEHHGFGHARTLYEEVLRVPLIISLPSSAPRVVDRRVSIVDLAPTLREIVGLDPAERSDGISLVPLLNGQSHAHPPVYAENFLSSQSKAVVWGGWKLIFTLPGNVYELYDLRTDPHERENLADAYPARLVALQKLLALCAASGCRDIDPQLLADVERTLTAP